ncbi:hypothetical protein [Chryseobacterium contaminans]|nr:hypothetical protein [Chryseobacterium contaminans]SHL34966.1 hypothetical protein SAMN05444407_103399 [Chryseobacterium contaminans]
MFLRNLFFIFFLAIIQIFNAQRKKADTIYVYEKVIIYDTVYLEKALKIQPKDLVVKPSSNIEGNRLHLSEATIKNEIERIKIFTTKKFQFGLEIGACLKGSSWAKELSKSSSQLGINAGLWISKPIIEKFSLMLSAHIYHWNSTYDLDANKEDTWLNGYYFAEGSQPLLFQKFNNKHFEYALQLKLFYQWKNFQPFIGILANKNIYKMQFLVPENMVLNKLDDFKSDQTNLGFSVGVQYKILKKALLSLEYQEYKMNNVSLKNSSYNFDIFKTNNTFAERKINFGISYIISGW